jgi:hypothetical protein
LQKKVYIYQSQPKAHIHDIVLNAKMFHSIMFPFYEHLQKNM